jgi:hypothetical protein
MLSKRIKHKKINFGCGWDKREGYLNVDVDSNCKPDLLIKNNDYSVIPKNHFNEILANDVLEHISHTLTLSTLLDWSEFLTDNGTLHIQTSSILGVARQLTKKKGFADQLGWTVCLFGNQAHEGDFHHVGFTETTLKVHLLAAGFKIDSFKERDQWLFHVDCHKKENWMDVITENKKADDETYVTAIFNAAFGRKPDELGGQYIRNALKNKELTRKQAAKHLFQSRERLYYIASQHNM